MNYDKIKKDLVKCYNEEDELLTIVEAVALENKAEYKHILDSYGISEETLIQIFAEMGYIEP